MLVRADPELKVTFAASLYVSGDHLSMRRGSSACRFILPALSFLLMPFFTMPSASAQESADASPPACTHDEALEMGTKLHQELDVSSPWWRAAKSEAEKKTLSDAFIALMDASDQALRGNDGEACRRYREIASEQGITLD